MARRTKPETPRAKRSKQTRSPGLTQRIHKLEGRMDALELTVVQKLDGFERTIISALASYTSEEYRSRNLFRALITGIGIVIIGVLFYIDGN